MNRERLVAANSDVRDQLFLNDLTSFAQPGDGQARQDGDCPYPRDVGDVDQVELAIVKNCIRSNNKSASLLEGGFTISIGGDVVT